MASNVVPYNPVPSQAPNAAPASPYLRVPSGTEEAAGVGVAQATQGLGREVQQASDMVAAHVLTLQNLDNETWAKDNDVTAMIQIGQTMSEFDQLEGKNQIDAMPQYQDKIKKIRQDLLDNAPNPMARRMLDQSISRRVGFALVDMGHKAGTSLKSANRAADNARTETAIATADPSSANSMTLAEKTITASIDSSTKGQLPPTVANEKRKALQRLWLTSIQKANDPLQAKAIFDLRQNQMDTNFREAAQNIVDTKMANKQSITDARQIMDNTKFDPARGPGQIAAIGDETKKFIDKYGQDNPRYAKMLENNVSSLYNNGMRQYRDMIAGYKNQLSDFIIGKDTNNRIVSVAGIVNGPPEIQKAYNGLKVGDQNEVIGWIDRINKGEHMWTPEKYIREQQLRGMASDPEQADKFYQMGPGAIIKEGFPEGTTRSLLNLQRTIKERAENVQLSQAIVLATPQLRAAGKDRATNPDAYNQFRGAFEDALRGTQEDQKAKVTPEQVRTITARLLREQATSHWYDPRTWNTKNQGPMYATENIPEADRKTVTDALIKLRGVEPTEQDIQRAYSYTLYRRTYLNKTREKANPDLQGLGQ